MPLTEVLKELKPVRQPYSPFHDGGTYFVPLATLEKHGVSVSTFADCVGNAFMGVSGRLEVPVAYVDMDVLKQEAPWIAKRIMKGGGNALHR